MNAVSPALVKVRYIVNLTWTVLCAVTCVVAAYFWGSWWHIGTAFFAVLFVWLLWLIPAQVCNMGWLETEDELLITKGKLWHKFTV